MEFIGIIAVVISCHYLGVFVGNFISNATDKIKRLPPEGKSEEEWHVVVNLQNKGEAGKWLGTLERILFFIAAYTQGYILIGGWLVFKVGSKWQVWNNLIKVPDELEGTDDFSYLKARQVWGSWLLLRFLIGTLLNILLGFGLAFLLKTILDKPIV